MAANVLRSERAVQMSVYVIRAFVRLRGIYRKLLPLLQPPPDPPKRPIGFRSGDEPAKAWRLPLRPGSELEGSRRASVQGEAARPMKTKSVKSAFPRRRGDHGVRENRVFVQPQRSPSAATIYNC
jgi:hypothetical protein